MGLSVAVIDEHPIVRAGIRAVLSAQEDLRWVGEAGDARAGYDMVAAVRPDLLMLDLCLPGADGLTAARELRRRVPALRLVLMSAAIEEHVVAEALHAGVLGCVSKE